MRSIYAILLLLSAAFAGAQLTTITANNITNIDNHAMGQGYFCLTPVLPSGGATPFTANGKQYTPRQQCWHILAGMASDVTVPDTAFTSPAIGYVVDVLDYQKAQVEHYSVPIFPTGSPWSFDAYSPPAPTFFAPAGLVAFGSAAPLTVPCTQPQWGYTDSFALYACGTDARLHLVTSGGGGGGAFDGGAVANPVILPRDAILSNEATTKHFVDNAVAVVASAASVAQTTANSAQAGASSAQSAAASANFAAGTAQTTANAAQSAATTANSAAAAAQATANAAQSSANSASTAASSASTAASAAQSAAAAAQATANAAIPSTGGNVSGNINYQPGFYTKWNGDTGLSRSAPGVLNVGNGAAGDASGTLNATLVQSGTVIAGNATGPGGKLASSPVGATLTNGNMAVWQGGDLVDGGPPGSGGGTAVTFAGDLTGTGTSQNVVGVQGQPWANTVPALNQVPNWNGTSWVPAANVPGSTATQVGMDAVKDLLMDNTNVNDIGAKLNTILNYSVQCSPTVTSSCVPAKIHFKPGVYKIVTPVHTTGSKWGDIEIECEGTASPYGGGRTFFNVMVPAGQNGMWFDAPSGANSFHAPHIHGCNYLDGTAYTIPSSLYVPSGTLNATSASDVNALLVFSGVDNLKRGDISFQYAIGNHFNPNAVNGGAAVTTGQGCVVTLNSYVVTCASSTATTAQAAQFQEGAFWATDSATGIGFAQEIYQATLSGGTLTIILSTPYQHASGTVFNWYINYGGHGFLIDGFGHSRTTNGNTGTYVSYSQYGSVGPLWSYCTQFPLWFGGGGAQSYLSGGSTSGTGGGTQGVSMYGTSRIRAQDGWFQGGCPANNAAQAPNGRIQNSVSIFEGGFTDTTDTAIAENLFTVGIQIENGHASIAGGWLENAGGNQPYNVTCTAALGSQSCTTGVQIGGDLTSGSHGAYNKVTAYVLSYGNGILLLPTAQKTILQGQIYGGNVVNTADIVMPHVGNPNCSSTTSCQALTTTTNNGTAGLYRYNVVTPPTVGGVCSEAYQVLHGTDGHDYSCSSGLVWVQH